MDIYKLNYKKLRKQMTLFMNTVYGKIVFILAYSIPIIFTCLLISLSIYIKDLSLNETTIFLSFTLMYILLTAILISFVIGTMYFYKQLRGFISSSKKD